MLLLINVMLLIDTGRLLEENGKVRNITEVSTSFCILCILYFVHLSVFVWTGESDSNTILGEEKR